MSSHRLLWNAITGIAGCCACRERPRRRASEQRDEFSSLHGLPLVQDSHPTISLQGMRHGASQQNRPLDDRFGSNARITAPQHFCPLHPNKQTRQDGLTAALCAISRHMQCSKFSEDSAPSSAGTSSVVDKVKIGRTLRVTNPINASG